MSTIGTQLQNSRSRAELSPKPSRADTPYLVLWSTGVVAFVLCMAAFALWGSEGSRTLFDIMIALCI